MKSKYLRKRVQFIKIRNKRNSLIISFTLRFNYNNIHTCIYMYNMIFLIKHII